MNWVTVGTFHYNAEHIVEFQWSNGTLYIWDDAPVADDVTENVCRYRDADGKRYRSLCSQLGLNPNAIGLPEPPEDGK